MATLDGIDLFGPVCTVRTVRNPRRAQMNFFAGVNGPQRKDMGGSGGVSTVDGWLVGAGVDDLDAAESSLRAYSDDPGVYTFVDNYGNPWPRTKLDFFEPEDRVFVGYCQAAGGECLCRRYRAILIHLA